MLSREDKAFLVDGDELDLRHHRRAVSHRHISTHGEALRRRLEHHREVGGCRRVVAFDRDTGGGSEIGAILIPLIEEPCALRVENVGTGLQRELILTIDDRSRPCEMSLREPHVAVEIDARGDDHSTGERHVGAVGNAIRRNAAGDRCAPLVLLGAVVTPGFLHHKHPLLRNADERAVEDVCLKLDLVLSRLVGGPCNLACHRIDDHAGWGNQESVLNQSGAIGGGDIGIVAVFHTDRSLSDGSGNEVDIDQPASLIVAVAIAHTQRDRGTCLALAIGIVCLYIELIIPCRGIDDIIFRILG
jgi:hypothetical protein